MLVSTGSLSFLRAGYKLRGDKELMGGAVCPDAYKVMDVQQVIVVSYSSII